jgi:hypothetical protein
MLMIELYRVQFLRSLIFSCIFIRLCGDRDVTKFVEYSQESMKMAISCNVPNGIGKRTTLDLNCHYGISQICIFNEFLST